MRLMRALACCGALLLSGGALGAQGGTGRVTGTVTQAGAAGGPVSDVAVTIVGLYFMICSTESIGRARKV